MADAPLSSRKEPRIPIKLFVSLYSPDNPTFEVASTIDISCHGARVVTKTLGNRINTSQCDQPGAISTREPGSFIVSAVRMIPL